MFARKVAVRLKPNSLTAFTNLLERDILPWLRKQAGFRDLIILTLTDSREVATISFWDYEKNAEVYNSNCYPEVLKLLEELLDGTPYVKTFEVIGSTCHGIALASHPDAKGLIGESDLTKAGSRSFETRL